MNNPFKTPKVGEEYRVDAIEEFLQSNGVDTSILDADTEGEDEPIKIGMPLTFCFDDGSIAATIIMTGYTAIMAVYRIAYLAECLE